MKLIAFIGVLLIFTGCTMTKYIPSKEHDVYEVSEKITPFYSVEITSFPTSNDSLLHFQIVENHYHKGDNMFGYKEYIYRYNESHLGWILGFGVGVGISAMISPPLAQIVIASGGIGILAEVIKALRKPKPAESDYIFSGKLTVVEKTPLSAVRACPISKKVAVEDEISVRWKDKSIVVKSQKDGQFFINPKFFINPDSIGKTKMTLLLQSMKLNISQNVVIDNSIKSFESKKEISSVKPVGDFSLMRSVNETSPMESGIETSEQLRNAENIYWSLLAKDSRNPSKKKIIWLLSSEKRMKELSKLSDQRILMNFAKNGNDFEFSKAAFNKLTNNSLLLVSESTDNEGLVLACKIKLNLLDWKTIFNKPHQSNNDLRNIIRAASLIDDTPEPDIDDIVRICHLYIRLGEDSHIPELCDLLSRYGDKTLAEDYLNCGKQELTVAARAWGRAHGYYENQGAGSRRVVWGGGK